MELAARRRGETAPHAVLTTRVTEQPHQVDEIPREVVDGLEVRPAQHRRRRRIGSRRTTDAEVDASRVQRLQEGELLGDRERGVVREHDASRTDPDRPRRRREVGDQHRGRRAGDGWHVVVLGDPEAVEAELVGVPGERRRRAQGIAARHPVADHREIEHREQRSLVLGHVAVGHVAVGHVAVGHVGGTATTLSPDTVSSTAVSLGA